MPYKVGVNTLQYAFIIKYFTGGQFIDVTKGNKCIELVNSIFITNPIYA